MMFTQFEGTVSVSNLKRNTLKLCISNRVKSSSLRYLLIALSLLFIIRSYPNISEMVYSLYFVAVIIFRITSKWTFSLTILILVGLVVVSSLHFEVLATTLGNYLFISLLVALVSGLVENSNVS